MDDFEPPATVVGVDFSADRRRAGEKIWVAEATTDADGLRVTDCRPVTERLDVSPARETAIPAVARLVGGRDGDVAVGMDFPFGLPEPVVAADGWTGFLRDLPSWADDPADLARECRARAETAGESGQQLRETERPLGALSPYNRRLRAQTFYGVRDLVRPLVLSGAALAVPMQPPASDSPTLLEVYPAGTLERLDAHGRGYKADDDEARSRRATNLETLESAGVELAASVRDRALEDADGDALDAVVAAVAAHEHTRDPADLWTNDETRLLEGHIYV